MPSVSQQNLETVMLDFFGALRGEDFDAAAALLDYRERAEALAAAGLTEDAGWR
jgi:hypothetical protein